MCRKKEGTRVEENKKETKENRKIKRVTKERGRKMWTDRRKKLIAEVGGTEDI